MSRLFIPPAGQPPARTGAHLFVEENAGRMLPGYRGKAEASYSVKFAPPDLWKDNVSRPLVRTLCVSKLFEFETRILEDFWKIYLRKKILGAEREKEKKIYIFSII